MENLSPLLGEQVEDASEGITRPHSYRQYNQLTYLPQKPSISSRKPPTRVTLVC